MAMQWLEVLSDETESIVEECAESFRVISKHLTAQNFTSDKLRDRLSKPVDSNSFFIPRPTLPDATIDPEVKMFRLWRFVDVDGITTLFTVALDRTLRRKPFIIILKPSRNHWCVSIGISANNDKDAVFIYNQIKDLLTSGLVPSSYRLALVWEARESAASDELNLPALGDPLPYPPKQIVDLVFEEMRKDTANVKFYKIPQSITTVPVLTNPLELGTEPAYNHFYDHIKGHIPAGDEPLIRSVEFRIT